MKITSLRTDRLESRYPFRITGHEWTTWDMTVIELADGPYRGRGECCGVYYRDDTPAHALAELQRVSGAIEGAAHLTRRDLYELLPNAGARNALDAALWELEAQRSGKPVWQLTNSREPTPLLTTQTCGADDPARMAERALAFGDAKAIKLKLTGDGDDAARVRAVRDARPDVWLGVDANQGFTRASLDALLPTLVMADVRLIEQPFPIGHDAALDGIDRGIPFAADESVQDLDDLARIGHWYDVVNIKLDKCGGLTRALEIEADARRRGMGVMVGCMGGSSLAMAPAYVLGLRCDLVDLDGPLLLVHDRVPGVRYDDGRIVCPPEVWGDPVRSATAS
jgi:L-alanine-DL-glutamate epimerase-like enolase superfamily enzyme